MGIKHYLRGAATFVPGAMWITQKRTGGSDTALYCYSVWLRHMSLAHEAGLCASAPRHVADFGPGDSIGVGLAALLSGAESFIGLDVKPFARAERNLPVFDELVALFRSKAAIPGPERFPQVKPFLRDYAFPSHIISDADLADRLSDARVSAIRAAIASADAHSPIVAYAVPWADLDPAPRNIDMMLSQAVMEYVPDLTQTYATLASWLSPAGFLSMQIDFKCHGCADEWNGHWRYSDLEWRLIKGRRGYYLNRLPFSAHEAAMSSAGLAIASVQKVRLESRYAAAELAPRFCQMLADDLTTGGAFILAKPMARVGELRFALDQGSDAAVPQEAAPALNAFDAAGHSCDFSESLD